MNREIKFKALTEDAEWVYGYYWRDNSNGKHKITKDLSDDNFRCYEIKIDTLGQFLGLEDVKGVEVYEGDCLIFTTYSESGITETKHDPVFVRWNNYKSCYDFYDNKNRVLGDYPFFHYWTLESMRNEEFEVIGNIYQNPELL